MTSTDKSYSSVLTLAAVTGVCSVVSYLFYRKLAKAETRERALNRQLAEVIFLFFIFYLAF